MGLYGCHWKIGVADWKVLVDTGDNDVSWTGIGRMVETLNAPADLKDC